MSESSTCGLSGLPIDAGTMVRFMLLRADRPKHRKVAPIHPEGYWTIYGIPFLAKCEEFGRVSEPTSPSDCESSAHIMELVMRESGGFDCLLDLQEWVRANPGDLGVCLLREDVWQAAMQVSLADGSGREDADSLTPERMLEDLSRMWMWMLSLTGLKGQPDHVVFGRDSYPTTLPTWHSLRDDRGYRPFYGPRHIMLDAARMMQTRAWNKDEADSFLDALVQTLWVREVAAELHHVWTPMVSTYRGRSRDLHGRWHETLAKLARTE